MRWAFHNPFLKDGLIKFPDNGNLVKHVERWAKVRGDKLAYRFLDFSTERDGVVRELNWADFGARNRAVGARLQQVTQPGDRVAILCPQNLEYLVAFFGTLYSGRIAVPLFDPSEPGHVGRLHAVLDDCQPSAILTTTESAEGVRKFFRSRPAKERPRVIAVDAVPDEVGATWEPVDVNADTIAYLQYTSGSTRIPTGVQITHLNLATNVVQVIEALDGEEGDRGVLVAAVLPRHGPDHGDAGADDRPLLHLHDPGGVRPPARPLDAGDVAPGQTTPAASSRWRRTSRSTTPPPADCPRTTSRRWTCPTSSASSTAASRSRRPPCAGSTRRSARTASSRRRSSRPTAWPRRRCSCRPRRWTIDPKIVSVDRDALNTGTFVEVPADSPSAVAQAGAGKVGIAEWAVIVDDETATELPDGQIGEIWISGQNMGTGYWGKPEETRATFQNILKSRTNPSHAEGATDDATWVRTGDLGAYHDGELYITGRVKDLVIIDGRNHYPQDLEYSAQESTKALRTGYVAAFSVPANQLPDEVFANAHSGLKRDPDDTSEQLVIVGERAPGAHKLDMGPIADDIRAADRGAPRRDGARRAADRRGRDPADVQRQDRPPRLPHCLSGRQPAQRQGGQRVPRRERTDAVLDLHTTPATDGRRVDREVT